MSIATEITRIKGLRDRIKSHLVSIGLLPLPQSGGDTPIDRDSQSQVVVVGDDLEACAEAIDNIEGTQLITATGTTYNVADKQYARVDDENLIAENIRDGVTILGITGILKDNYAISYATRPVIRYGGENRPAYRTFPTPPYNAFDTYSFALESGSNLKLKPENIKTGITINGVTGIYNVEEITEYTEGYPTSGKDPVYVYGSKTIEIDVEYGSGVAYAPYYDGDCINHNNEWLSPAKELRNIKYGSFFLEPYNTSDNRRINCALGPFIDGHLYEQVHEIIKTQDNHVVIGAEFYKEEGIPTPWGTGWDTKIVLTTLSYSRVNRYEITRIVCGDDTTYELDWHITAFHRHPTIRITLGRSFSKVKAITDTQHSYASPGESLVGINVFFISDLKYNEYYYSPMVHGAIRMYGKAHIIW